VICRLIGYRHPSASEFEEDAISWTVKEETGRDEQHRVGKTIRKKVQFFHEVLMCCTWGSQLRYLTKFTETFRVS
jgi:hypothetical protein